MKQDLFPLAEHIDLSAAEFWTRTHRERDAAFAVLRRETPVRWFGPPEAAAMPAEDRWGTGYWAVVRHADVQTVSRNPRLFTSTRGVMFGGGNTKLLRATQSFLGEDPPRHTELRGLIGSVFTPRALLRIRGRILENARAIVASLPEDEEFDFVDRVAARLPLLTIADILGIPRSELERTESLINQMFGRTGADEGTYEDSLRGFANSAAGLAELTGELIRDRSRRDGEDVLSILVRADIGGRRLRPEEIAAFFTLLVSAGYETTRSTMSDAVHALSEHPDQRRLLLEDLPGRMPTAVEEFIRWASPVRAFCRTATRETVVAGQRIAAGERVAMFYRSANRDESAFVSPEVFDVIRSPNPHVGFGGGGVHNCLGAALARMELNVMITQFLLQAPDFETEQPEHRTAYPILSERNRRIAQLPCRISGR